jgi:hypothetical protein
MSYKRGLVNIVKRFLCFVAPLDFMSELVGDEGLNSRSGFLFVFLPEREWTLRLRHWEAGIHFFFFKSVMCAFGNSYRSIRRRGGVQNKPWYTTFKPFLFLVADTQTCWTLFAAKVSEFWGTCSREWTRSYTVQFNEVEVQKVWTLSGMRGEGWATIECLQLIVYESLSY